MCPPTFLSALTSEHSWCPSEPNLDVALATDQWQRLAALVEQHVAPVELLQPEPWARAMTFTRDIGVAVESMVVPLMPHLARGPLEAPLAHRHLRRQGYRLREPLDSAPVALDGGNVIADSHGRLLVGLSTEAPDAATVAAVRALEALTARAAYRVPLVGGRFPHIDMAVCDLGGRAWLVHPAALPGFDLQDLAWRQLFLDVPVIQASPDDAELLGCNLVVHQDIVIGPAVSSALRRAIEGYGFGYIATPLSEFRKAGGGAHCLTLELPGHLGSSRHGSADDAGVIA